MNYVLKTRNALETSKAICLLIFDWHLQTSFEPNKLLPRGSLFLWGSKQPRSKLRGIRGLTEVDPYVEG